IDTCDFEHVDEKRLVLHLRTLRAAIRASEEVLEKVIGMLCVEALARLLVECDGERITKEAMRTVAMTAHSGAGRDHLQATHSIAVL
uniref:hypothetical protein n=1 Tax=Vibrio cholerae TaxID=666 RepID=UPI001F35C316